MLNTNVCGNGMVVGELNARCGMIIDREVHEDELMALMEVALNDMFVIRANFAVLLCAILSLGNRGILCGERSRLYYFLGATSSHVVLW